MRRPGQGCSAILAIKWNPNLVRRSETGCVGGSGAPASGFVVGFRSIEDAFQRIEMPLRRSWAVVEFRAANFALGLLDHRGRQLFERLARPHGVDLNLRCALEVIEPVIGLGDSDTE